MGFRGLYRSRGETDFAVTVYHFDCAGKFFPCGFASPSYTPLFICVEKTNGGL
jgi:hypothetical protein